MKSTIGRYGAVLGGIAVVLLSSLPAMGQASVRVNKTYEDTVRIVIIWNTTGMQTVVGCEGLTESGAAARDFTLKALDINQVPNIKVFQSESVTLTDVQGAFGIDKPPHVVVHINAGWGVPGAGTVTTILNWAAANYIGVVEIGDDAAYLTQGVFQWSYTGNIGSNLPSPMYAATWLKRTGDSLWVTLEPAKDNLMDPLKYPGLNGIVRNAAGILGSNTMTFKPFSSGRCEADPDSFLVPAGAESKIRFLGYQQGWNQTLEPGSGGYPNDPANDGLAPRGLVGGVDQFINIAAFQDSVSYGARFVIRRAVALSFEPQYIKNESASAQVVYDAIMFSSLAHTLKPVAVEIGVSTPTITAGEFSSLTATILNDELTPAQKAVLSQHVQWSLIGVPRPGDSLTLDSGATTQVTGTRAFRPIQVQASFYDSAFNMTVTATTTIMVNPGPDYKVSIEKTSATQLTSATDILPKTYTDSITPPTPDTLVVRMSAAQNVAYAYAVVRDRFGNIKRVALNGYWQELPPPGAVTAAGTSGKLWEGTITRALNEGGSDSVRAWEGALTVGDTVKVIVIAAPITGLASAVTGDIDGDGYLDRIVVTFDSLVSNPVAVALAGFAVKYKDTQWQIDSVRTQNGASDVTVIIYLKEQTTQLQTDWVPTLTMPSIGITAAITDYLTTDKVGPVIKSAVLFRPALKDGILCGDTLHVTFSEKVQWPGGPSAPADVFFFYDSSGRNALAFANIVAGSMVAGTDSALIVMSNCFLIVPYRDSVQFQPTQRVTDQVGNSPSANGRKVMIIWGVKNELNVASYNNPFYAGSSDPGDLFPPQVVNYYRNVFKNVPGSSSTPGVLLAVQVVMPLVPLADGSYGTGVVYDAVGNIVRDDLRLDQATPADYAIIWDGRNRNKRVVGGGTYLVAVKATGIDGMKLNKRIKVGIRIKP